MPDAPPPSADPPRDLPAAAPPADGEALRLTLRHVASPVVLVTTRGADGPRGATMGSFASVALSPPLVSFNVQHGSRLYSALEQNGPFAVQLLADTQADVADHFATPHLTGAEQLAPFAHREGPHGLSLVDGVLATLVCRPHAWWTAGDHAVVAGRVEQILPGEPGDPLLWYARGYRTVGGAALREPAAGIGSPP